MFLEDLYTLQNKQKYLSFLEGQNKRDREREEGSKVKNKEKHKVGCGKDAPSPRTLSFGAAVHKKVPRTGGEGLALWIHAKEQLVCEDSLSSLLRAEESEEINRCQTNTKERRKKNNISAMPLISSQAQLINDIRKNISIFLSLVTAKRSSGTMNSFIQLFIQLCAQQVYLETDAMDRLLIRVRNQEGEPGKEIPTLLSGFQVSLVAVLGLGEGRRCVDPSALIGGRGTGTYTISNITADWSPPKASGHPPDHAACRVSLL